MRNEAVLLIHGTFAYFKHDNPEEDEEPKFGQVGHEFETRLNRMLHGIAEVWPQEVQHPWNEQDARSPEPQFYGRNRFVWTGKNRDGDRLAASHRLLDGLLEMEQHCINYHLVGHSHGGTVIWHALQKAAQQGSFNCIDSSFL